MAPMPSSIPGPDAVSSRWPVPPSFTPASTEAQAATFLARLAALPIAVDDETSARAWAETIALARAHGLSTYDAAYLELAVRGGLPIATLHDRLKAAAKAVGVPVYKP